MELPKRYDAHEAEERWQAAWRKMGVYAFNPNANAPVYSIDTPPPTFSGKMHLGHSFSYAQQDFIARYHRMKGENVFYPFGVDDNGLPTDRLVEKTRNVRSRDFEREAYRKLVEETVDGLRPAFIADWVRLGMSCDFSLTYSTISKECQRIAQKSFLDLYKKGLIYRAETPVAWCPSCRTAIAQAEFENIDKTSQFNDVRFSCGKRQLVIATTRPEMIPACVALFAHPDDERYADLKGKFATVPLFNYDVPILFDEAVEKDKGTGLMMVCTFGDKEDVEKWRVHKLPLRVIFTEDGKLNELAQGYEGLSIIDARKKIIADLDAHGYLLKQEPITHAVNVHERCGTPIEFLKTPQWFIRVLDHKEKLLEAGRAIRWYPAHMRVRFEHWVQNLNFDWCISRQRFHGVPFPVWHKDDGEVILADEAALPVDPTRTPKPGAHADTDVMDTWNISSLTPQIALRWGHEENLMQLFPMSMRPQAHDIIRTWAFYTIVKAYFHHGTVPWKDIVISGHVLDPKGQKMSKSKGNVIAPQDVMKKYSADALRFWAAGVKLGDDLPYMEKDLQTGQKTITKLWNAMKFTLMHLEHYEGFTGELAVLDRWILSKFARVVKDVTDHFDRYEYSKTRFETEQFFWRTFCDNYLELVKARLYNPEAYGEAAQSAQHTLYSVALG
ncbi:valine--tRNA ligase, partial [Candidatus Woesearchaeota archaeon]